MGWKSTMDLKRSDAELLILKKISSLSKLTDSEICDLLYVLNYGDDPDLEYYGHNFHIIDN